MAIGIGNNLRVQQNTIRNPFIDFFFFLCQSYLFPPQVSEPSVFSILAIWAVSVMGCLSWYGPQLWPVICLKLSATIAPVHFAGRSGCGSQILWLVGVPLSPLRVQSGYRLHILHYWESSLGSTSQVLGSFHCYRCPYCPLKCLSISVICPCTRKIIILSEAFQTQTDKQDMYSLISG